MADFGALMAGWEPLLKKKHPHIDLGFEPYEIFKTVGISNNEKKAVGEGGKDVMTMLDELSGEMERLSQHNGSPSIHRFHPSHSQCCQHAAPPCCHHDHGPRDVPGCHHHGARKRSASHHHDPRGPCDLHHRGQRGPPHMEESSDDEDYGAASSEPPSSWRVCGVCYNNYNINSRRPTSLMCGHTFCRQCLGEIAVRGPLRCPNCNASERRPTAALPPNVVLMAALED